MTWLGRPVWSGGWLVWIAINAKEGDCWYLIETSSFAYKDGSLLIPKRVSIILLSLMSNLLSIDKIIAYMIQVLSLSWLMKKIWLIKEIWLVKKIWKGFNQQDLTKIPSGKVELWLFNEVQDFGMVLTIEWQSHLITQAFVVTHAKQNMYGSQAIVCAESLWCWAIQVPRK